MDLSASLFLMARKPPALRRSVLSLSHKNTNKSKIVVLAIHINNIKYINNNDYDLLRYDDSV